MKNILIKQWKKSNNLWISFKKGYKEKIHNKWYSSLLYIFLFTSILSLLIFLNIMFMSKGKYSFDQIFGVLFNWSDGKDGYIDSIDFKSLAGDPLDHFQSIQRQWFNVGATLLGGIGMTLAAIATQSLTKNPIAEGSTLGLVQAGIFGIIFAISFGMSSLLSRYIWVIAFSAIGALLLLGFIIFSKRKGSSMQKIILAGLAIGIIFKTLTFIFKAGNQSSNAVSFAYVLGGAESISGETKAIGHDLLPLFLMISFILIMIAVVIAVINIKGMNVLEIGDERAKNLGSSVMLTKILNITIVLFALPAAVMVVGNMAFLGLFTVHLARWATRSRNYKKVLPVSLVIGMMIASLGYQLTEHIPQINSGIWMTFIGAPYLIYIGIRGLK